MAPPKGPFSFPGHKNNRRPKIGTKYTSQSTTGYNASAPSDDGSATEANKVKWSTIKTKLADVLKTFAEAINSAIVTALDKSARAVSANDNSAATDHDRTIQVNTASVTVTLADAATMAAGYTVSVANQSTGNVTVALASATDTIDTVTNTTQILGPKETRRYIVNATATGYLTASARFGISDLTEDTSPDLGADYVATYDASGAILKKVLLGRAASGVLGTEQASTSGTSIDFTGIPSWAKKITVLFAGVSLSGTANPLVQIGDSGGAEDSGYLGASTGTTGTGGGASTNFTAGFGIASAAAANVLHGSMTIYLQDASNTWVSSHVVATSNAGSSYVGGGTKSLSATLDRVRITTSNGSDTFDAGAVNILYE